MTMPPRPILTATRTLAASAAISIYYCLIAFAAISATSTTTTSCSFSSCYVPKPKSPTTATIFYFATAFSLPLPPSRIFATSSSINKAAASSTLFQRQVSTISRSNNNSSNRNTIIMAASSTISSTAATSPISFMDYSPAYKSLVNHLRTISHLHHASSVLNYDRQVFMPTSDLSSMARGQQLATLASIAHEKSIDPQLGTWIAQAKQDLVKLKEEQQQQHEDIGNSDVSLKEDELVDVARLLELEQKSYHKQICIPLELAARKAELEASANHAWVKVRYSQTRFSSWHPSPHHQSYLYHPILKIAHAMRQHRHVKIMTLHHSHPSSRIVSTLLPKLPTCNFAAAKTTPITISHSILKCSMNSKWECPRNGWMHCFMKCKLC